jgi:hypothetical protein
MELYFDENNYLVFSGITTDYVLCVTDPTPPITPSISVSKSIPATATPTWTPTSTPILTVSNTQTPTVTPTLTPTLTVSLTQTPTVTPTLTVSNTQTPTVTPTLTPTFTGAYTEFCIGRSPSIYSPAPFCKTDAIPGTGKGKIDSVGLWSRALTAAEITTLYNSGTGTAYLP